MRDLASFVRDMKLVMHDTRLALLDLKLVMHDLEHGLHDSGLVMRVLAYAFFTGSLNPRHSHKPISKPIKLVYLYISQ